MLGILNVRAIVNNNDIYPLTSTDPVVIEVNNDHPMLVVTDGFHFTKPIELVYKEPSYYHFKVVCAIDDFQLLANFIILAFLYLLGFISGVFIIKLLSFLPIVYLLFVYYVDRDSFLQIKQDKLLRKPNRR